MSAEELEDEVGVCMNCGGEMDYSPMHPWCPKCDEEEAEAEKEAPWNQLS